MYSVERMGVPLQQFPVCIYLKGTVVQQRQRYIEQKFQFHIVNHKLSMKCYLVDHIHQKHAGYRCTTCGCPDDDRHEMLVHKQYHGHLNYVPNSPTHKNISGKRLSEVNHLLLVINIYILNEINMNMSNAN